MPAGREGTAAVRVIMLGPPGVGKGTQGDLIATRYDVPHVSTGEIFRAEAARDTPLGQTLTGYLESGDLVPDDLVLRLMMDGIIAAAHASGGYVLDGFPRTLPQAEAAAARASEAGISAQAVVYLDAPADVLLRRVVTRGEDRPDDSAEVARHRLKVYAEQTKPLLDYYTGLGIVMRVDASPPVEEVSEQVFQALDRLRPPPAQP
jgi:adenylate kinase